MKVEVLASVMNASLPETIQHMNLQSDAVIINRCDQRRAGECRISRGPERSVYCSFPDRSIAEAIMGSHLRAEGHLPFSDDRSHV